MLYVIIISKDKQDSWLRKSTMECYSKSEFLLINSGHKSIYRDFMKKQLSDMTQQWQHPRKRTLYMVNHQLKTFACGNLLGEANLRAGRFSLTNPKFLFLLSWSLQTDGSVRHSVSFSWRASWSWSTHTLQKYPSTESEADYVNRKSFHIIMCR